MKFFLITLATLLLTLQQPVAAQTSKPASQQSPAAKLAQDMTRPEQSRSSLAPLISVAKMSQDVDLNSDQVKILEPGIDRDIYARGHIQSAQFLHWVDDMTDPENVACYNNPQSDQFLKLMTKLGINNDDRIIIYDRLDSRLSTRLFWTLKYFGHDHVQILDGGFAAWQQAGHNLSKISPKFEASEYKIRTIRKEFYTEIEHVKNQLKKPGTRLIDGRPTDQFSGRQAGEVFHTKQVHPRRGHIPGATNIFWANNLNADGTFKSPAELRALYTGAGIKPMNNVITYCNEGLHAAPPWFVLTQLLDYKNVRLYDSSLAEWAQSDNPMSIDELAEPDNH